MIASALMLAMQAAVPSAETLAAHPPMVSMPATQPQRVAIDPVEAIALFRALCLPHLTDAGAFVVAVAGSGVPFTTVPSRDGGTGQTWRSDRALIRYGQSADGATRCTLLARTAKSVDQLSFSAKLAEALALKTGRTRTGKGQGVTEWSAAGPEGRTVQISAATRNAAGGAGMDIRLSAALGK
ncbi:MAG TPA: hypothetical protein VF649_12950 [Sphingomonas sp.]|jgi:hypothetical protein|uniref:hypothetical protein n=1 Tax=Sphingomonas sp. TaxID=28214 RepID=UPI002ED7D76B